MAQDVRMTERVKVIYDRRGEIFDRSQIPVRDTIYWEEFDKHPDDIRAVQFAYGFSRFLKEKKIQLCEYDLMAGNAFAYTFNTTLPIDCPLDYDPHFRAPVDIDPMRESREAIEFYGYEEGCDDYKLMMDFGIAVKNWLIKHWESGHIIPGYERLLKIGYGGILAECDEALKMLTGKEAEFTRSMRIVTQAAIDYIGRYEALARQLAETASTPEYKVNMERIADACAQIAAGPATTFFEAIQLTWFTHELLYAETTPASQSFGRMDQFLYPYYKASCEAGEMDYEFASELMDCLWIKFSHNLHSYQNVTIGGADMNGVFMGNDLTKIMMQSSRKLQFDQPTLCMRYHESIPDDIWEEAVALLKCGNGFPAFFYDNACAAAKMRMGHSKEDAYNYGMVGCVETSCPGKEYAKTEVLRMNWPMVMELMLTDGKSKYHEDVIKPFTSRDLDSIETFDEFYDWYKDELLKFSALAMEAVNRLDPMLPETYPSPFLSILMEGCIQNGKDVTGGGTVYNNTGISTCGQADVADALAVIKKLVYDEHKYKLSELAEAAYNDFEAEGIDYSDMLADIAHCPKYGNDDDSVDLYVKEIVDLLFAQADSTSNPRGGKFQMGIYTVEDHAKMGVRTGGLVTGRKGGTALANGFSPEQGKDVNGPTAMLNSTLKTDLTQATNGMVLDLKFSPSFLATKEHTDALRQMMNAYFKSGGMEIQFNVIDRETLIAAQKDPVKYKDLVVRVSGFSAYFHSLIKETQDEIIARTEYGCI